ncbi:hypothetical protein [Pseudogulbenkiania sp. MAI-1]|uniref:hypothetical protein n=1 Tax=Pseudogulbenkiania sp. MAI-1 TaxID=990370 RepID=UPI00055E25D6|nr:hypothetical protein [Pseudogulbenkiania sp. MAI-1]
MDNPIASLTEVRLDKLALESGMNSGPAYVEGNVAFAISTKSTFTVGGEQSEPSYLLGRVLIDANAVVDKDQKILNVVAEFIGRYEFDISVDDSAASELVKNRDYCELLGLQMQSFVSAKFSELVGLVGLDLHLPLNIIRLGRQPKDDTSTSC